MFENKNQEKKREKLSQVVMNDIIKEILNDKENSITYLPSENRLSEVYDVSRVTIREAIRGLEERGFVERQQGKGVKVIDNSIEVVSNSLRSMMQRSRTDPFQLLEIRKIIELQTARLSAIRADEQNIQGLNDSIKGMKDAFSTQEEYINYDLNFHILLAEASKNEILESIMKALKPLLIDSIKLSLEVEQRPEPSTNFHKHIYEKVVARDADGAEKHMKEHLEGTERRIKLARNLNNEDKS